MVAAQSKDSFIVFARLRPVRLTDMLQICLLLHRNQMVKTIEGQLKSHRVFVDLRVQLGMVEGPMDDDTWNVRGFDYVLIMFNAVGLNYAVVLVVERVVVVSARFV